MQHRRELRPVGCNNQQPSPRRANARKQSVHRQVCVLILLLTAAGLAVLGVLKAHHLLPAAVQTQEVQMKEHRIQQQVLAGATPAKPGGTGLPAPGSAAGAGTSTQAMSTYRTFDSVEAKHVKRTKHVAVPQGTSTQAPLDTHTSISKAEGPLPNQPQDHGCRHSLLPAQLQYTPLEKLRAMFDPASNARYYDIGSWRHSKLPELRRLLYQQAGGVEGDMCFFVRSSLLGLTLGAGRWLLAGARLPDNATDMAASGPHGKLQLLRLLSEAKDLGLNTVRLVAFKDGHTLPYALQVAPGVLDDWVVHEGLDWIVWQARNFGLRVLLVLTSALHPARGGMSQYVRWFDPQGTITDFYRNDTYKVDLTPYMMLQALSSHIKLGHCVVSTLCNVCALKVPVDFDSQQARFFDYMTALAVRENAYTRIQHRHDPAILGWEIAEQPIHPGPTRHADDLQAWLPYMANFMRRMDPNHLIFAGGHGLFGEASPHHLHLNPPLQPRLSWLMGTDMLQGGSSSLPPNIHMAGACEGSDFMRNSMIREVDMSAVSVLPDEWLACDNDCKMRWARDWVAAHVRDALRMQKPLLVGHMHMRGAPARQRALERLVLDYLVHATKLGMPIAGAFVSLPSQTFCSAEGAQHSPEWNTTCMTPQPDLPDSSPAQQPLSMSVGTSNAVRAAHQDTALGDMTGGVGKQSNMQQSGNIVRTAAGFQRGLKRADDPAAASRGAAGAAPSQRASSIRVRPSTELPSVFPEGHNMADTHRTAQPSSNMLPGWWAWLASLIPTPAFVSSLSPGSSTGAAAASQANVPQAGSGSTYLCNSNAAGSWAAADPEAVTAAYWRHFIRSDEWLRCLHKHATADFLNSMRSEGEFGSSRADSAESEDDGEEQDAASINQPAPGSSPDWAAQLRGATARSHSSSDSDVNSMAAVGGVGSTEQVPRYDSKQTGTDDTQARAHAGSENDSIIKVTASTWQVGGGMAAKSSTAAVSTSLHQHSQATKQAVQDMLASAPQT